jgi:hypothetical protein
MLPKLTATVITTGSKYIVNLVIDSVLEGNRTDDSHNGHLLLSAMPSDYFVLTPL